MWLAASNNLSVSTTWNVNNLSLTRLDKKIITNKNQNHGIESYLCKDCGFIC